MPAAQATLENETRKNSRSASRIAELRVFISDDNVTTIVCPKCNRSVTQNLGNVRKIPKAIRIKCTCSCGHEYKVLLERRKHYRRKTNLGGRYIHNGKNGNLKKGLIRIVDISQAGIQFKTNSKPELKPGETITIEFILNDEDHSKIEKECRVVRVKGFRVGVEFLTTEHYGALGAYLLS